MKLVRIEILHSHGKSDVLSIEADRILIGAGAHCDVRLGIDQAATEHIALHVSASGIIAEALSTNPPCTIDGYSFTRANLQPTSVITVAQTQLRAIIVQPGATAASKGQGTNPLLIVGVVAAAGYAAYSFLDSDDDAKKVNMPTDVPALFTAAPTTCPQKDPSQVRYLAIDSHSRADAKRERRPFVLRDGVDAVPLYQLASVCYAAVGEADRARETSNIADALIKEVTDDYRTHQVRLERALTAPENLPLASKEVKVLLSLMEGRDAAKKSKYVAWLSEQERRLRLKLGKSVPNK